MFGATPEVIRRHYEKLDQMKIAKQSVERHLSVVYEVAGKRPTRPTCRCVFEWHWTRRPTENTGKTAVYGGALQFCSHGRYG